MAHGIKVQLLDLGGLRGDESYFYKNANYATASNPNPEARWSELTIYAGLIEHPDAGLLLYEVGGPVHPEKDWVESGFADAFQYTYETRHHLDEAIKIAGHDIADVKGVIVGHLHSDHAGGLEWFRGTDIPLYVHEDELSNAFLAVATGDSPGFDYDYLDTSFNWVTVRGERTELFAGIELIHLPGHTPGLIGAVVELDNSDPLFFVSDQLIFEEHLTGREQGTAKSDDWNWFHSRRLVQRIATSRHARIVYGHDPSNVENFGLAPTVIS